MKPPMCANHATLLAVLPTLERSCIKNHIPMNATAGTLMTVMKMKMNRRVFIRALGNFKIYAPRIADTAPLAPITGTVEDAETAICRKEAAIPPKR